MSKWLFLLFFPAFAMVSCDDADDLFSDLGNSNFQVQAGFLEGKWVVHRFVDDGEDETDSFEGVVFEFSPNGVFHIYRNSNLLTSGSWSLDDNNTELDIELPDLSDGDDSLGEDLYEIEEDWAFRNVSNDEMELFDDDDDDDEFFELHRE